MGIDATQLKKPDRFTMKQIIIVRKDIKMSKGKLAAQVAHASGLALYDAEHGEYPKEWVSTWLQEGFPKIVLKANNEEELRNAFKEAESKNLPTAIVSDFGLTELEPGTVTAVAIGPAPVEKVDSIGRRFKLL